MELKRNLYICDQTFEFFNILNLQTSANKYVDADIIFSDKNDFSSIVDKVNKRKLFQNIFTIQIKEFENGFYSKEEEERCEIVLNPRNYISFPEFTEYYTDIWINISNIHAKLEYYNLVKLGMKPKIHLIQEGIANYTFINSISEEDAVWEQNYGELAFSKNIADNYIYRVNAFSGNGIENKPLLPIEENREELLQIVEDLYGKVSLPEQKWIYMETSLFDMNIMTNEFEIFEDLAKIVGKENIIVKRHPRNSVERYSPLGYSVMEESGVPWEVVIMENLEEIKNKIVCSVFSQSLFSPYDVFNIETKSIMLLKLLRHHVFLYEKKEWKEYISETEQEINRRKLQLYMPESVDELNNMIRFLLLDGRE